MRGEYTMLTQQQTECIEHLTIGTMTIQEIADKIGCTTRVIYKWKNNQEFKAELEKHSREFQTGIIYEANSLLTSKLGQAVKNIVDIANDKTASEKVRLDANQYLINRILGNTTTKIEQSNTDTTGKNADIDIDQLINEVKEDNNIVELKEVK
jgi:uncharacterized protein YjcR